MKKNSIQIREYQPIVQSEKKIDGYVTLNPHTFEQLENFILQNRTADTDALELMSISARKGVGKVITAKNYVGLIALKDGTVIEILPKIFSAIDDDQDATHSKKLVVAMLRTLRDAPYKNLQTSNTNLAKMNIFEIFVRMFIDEVFLITKKGLKCSYESVEENVAFFRGKMQFSKQLQQNFAHKERSYMQYDVFTANRAENKLLKTTLQYLYQHSTSFKNRNDIKILLNIFADIDVSVNYKSDFEKYILDRNTKDYTNALMWSKVFLLGKSFTSYKGSEVSIALLFPMDVLYESYVATLLKKKFDSDQYILTIQDKRHHLFEVPDKHFLMKPDIVLTRKSTERTIILDTKWKLLSSDKKINYGISQGDMYQMYAYQKKYVAEEVILLYPRTDQISLQERIEYCDNDGALVKVRFVDLFDVQNSLNALAEEITQGMVKGEKI